MSERTYAKVQAQNRPSRGVLPQSSLLQRTCACGQHRLLGTECSTCRNERLALSRSQRAFRLLSASGVTQDNSSLNSLTNGASRFGHDFSQTPIHSAQAAMLQTKLKVNRPGDAYEREADRVAEQVMRMSALESPVLDNGDEAKPPLPRNQSIESQADAATDTPSVPPIVHDVLNSGGGQPLDATTRAFVEPRFGYDFSQVRVHSDEQATESARSVNALAYTVGRDVVFGKERYAPATQEGRRLLVHELTHVVQQDNQVIPQTMDIAVSPTDSPLERESEHMADALITERECGLGLHTSGNANGKRLLAQDLTSVDQHAHSLIQRQPPSPDPFTGRLEKAEEVFDETPEIHELNDDTFNTIFDNHDKVVVIDFWATYCQPCNRTARHLANVVHTITPEFADLVKFYHVQLDSEESRGLNKRFRFAIPMVYFYYIPPASESVRAGKQAPSKPAGKEKQTAPGSLGPEKQLQGLGPSEGDYISVIESILRRHGHSLKTKPK